MDINRAKQILNSSSNIEVLYNNKPIWIENLDEAHKIAKIKILENKININVPIIDLTETHENLMM